MGPMSTACQVGIDIAHGDAMLGAGLQLADHDVVRRQHDLAAGLGRLVQQLDGLVHEVVLAEAFADGFAPGLEERVGHGAADDDAVDLGDQVLDDADLVGDLLAAEDGHERPLRILDGVAEELELLLDQEPDDAGLAFHDRRNGVHGGVVPVGGAEGVIDVDIGHRGQLLGELVLRLAELGRPLWRPCP